MTRSQTLADDVAQPLCDGATLVTANKRLAREVRQQFNQHQLAQGNQAWDTADILPFDAWIFRLWQFVRDAAKDDGAPYAGHVALNALQSKAVWTQIIAADIKANQRDAETLWNIAATVKTAMQAWRISRQWDIAIDDCGKSFLADHRSFARWANLFIHQCRKNNWIDAAQLVDVIIERIDARRLADFAPLMLLGFDGFNAQQKRLMEILRQNNTRLSIHQVADSGARSHCRFRQYERESEQWLAAAHWIKDKLDHNPNQRLALVASNLAKSRSAIDYALSQILSPRHLVDSGGSRAKPFHISLGVKLNDSPVVDAALLLLSLTSTADLTHSTLSRIMLTPFIGGADSECYARNKLEFWCRLYLPYKLNLADFLETLKLEMLKRHSSAPVAPIFLDKITAIKTLLEANKKPQSFSYWSELFLTGLENFGWPGQRALNSAQYQTAEAFKREVSALRSLDLVAAPLTAAAALAVLTQRLNEQPFEPESLRVQVEVLGIMETAGLEFDAIWFGGLTERDWPPAVRASPFIPHALQQQAGYFRAAVMLNAEYAAAQQTRLINQCDDMVFSRYRFEQDVELLPSAFFDASAATLDETKQPTLVDHFQTDRSQMETFTDTRGIGKTEAATRGGAAVIQDQAACPFRAYARHRLGARAAEAREPGLNAMDRGSLIHRILEGVWRELRSSEKLADTSDAALKKIIDRHIAQCSRRFFHLGGGGKAFFAAQSQWLAALLLEWLGAEKSREQAFRVVALEQPQQLALGKLTLNFKIDRVDALADDTLALIDYKTGQANALRDWVGERPAAPQLPLYALAQHREHNPDKRPLSTLTFAQIRAGRCAYVGISGEQFQAVRHAAGKVAKLSDTKLSPELKSWRALIEYWDAHLTQLADQYYAGQAEVNPLDNTTCTYCDLPGLCRISEADNSR